MLGCAFVKLAEAVGNRGSLGTPRLVSAFLAGLGDIPSILKTVHAISNKSAVVEILMSMMLLIT